MVEWNCRQETTGIIYISCSHEDYLKANHNEVPEGGLQSAERLKT